MHSQILIIGSGPAGYSAAIYAARAGLETTVLAGHMAGGQLILTGEVENYPGFSKISGIDLMENFQKQAQGVGAKIKYESAASVDFSTRPFKVKTDMGTDWTADSVIIATGSSPRWLNIPGEEKYKGKGISVCATCDGFFYRGKAVAIIGGGNSAGEEALHLSKIVRSVLIITQRDALTADKQIQKELSQESKIKILLNSNVTKFDGDEKLKSLTVKNTKTSEESTIPADGVFIAIGSDPNSALFKDILNITEAGYIVTNKNTLETSVPGVFACGDVQEENFRQAIIAAGTGCIAALSAEKFLQESEKPGKQ